MTKRGNYPPQYTIPSQAPSGHKAYDTRVQPDMYAQQAKVGPKPLRYVPEGLQNTGDPLFQRTPQQMRRAAQEQDLSFLGPSARSITQALPSGVYALFSADGTPQDIPSEENFQLVGTFPLGFDPESNTFFPDTTGSSTPSSNVTVTNVAGNAVFVQPGTGAVFTTQISGTPNVLVTNTVAQAVPVVLASGSFPSNVTVVNDLATEPIPVVNLTGDILDVSIAGASNPITVDFGGTAQPVTVSGTANVAVTNVVTTTVTGTVSVVDGGPTTTPGTNVTDANALPLNIALLYGREGANVNTPIAVTSGGAVLTTSVGTTGVDGTVTVDNLTSQPIPVATQDTTVPIGTQLGTPTTPAVVSVLYGQTGGGASTFDPIPLGAVFGGLVVETDPSAPLDVNVTGGVISAGVLTLDLQAPAGERTVQDAIEYASAGTNINIGSGVVPTDKPLGRSQTGFITGASGNQLIEVSPLAGGHIVIKELVLTIGGSVATPGTSGVRIVVRSVDGSSVVQENLIIVPLRLGTVGGYETVTFHDINVGSRDEALGFEIETLTSIAGLDIEIFANVNYYITEVSPNTI